MHWPRALRIPLARLVRFRDLTSGGIPVAHDTGHDWSNLQHRTEVSNASPALVIPRIATNRHDGLSATVGRAQLDF